MSLPLYDGKRSDGRTFCGPWCVMSITGRPYEEVRAAINDYRGRRPTQAVKGTHANELRAALWKFGYTESEIARFRGDERPTLAAWLRSGKRRPDLYYLITVSNHWVLVAGNRLTDTYSGGPVLLRDAPWRRALVSRVIAVRKR